MIIVFVLIILEGAITVDVFLNTNWEEVKSCSTVDYGWYFMLFSLYLLCLIFFPFLFVYHYVILMLWIVICEPESAWGWSTCCEEDWKCCHWTEQPTKACLHYKRVWWNVNWSLNAANRALLMLLMCRPCLVDESTGRDCRLWIFMIKLPNVTFGSCCNL